MLTSTNALGIIGGVFIFRSEQMNKATECRLKARALTAKQEAIFDYIRQSIKDCGFPPTVREIGDHFGITVKGAYDHIKAIEKKGCIKTEQGKSRAIVIVENGSSDSDAGEDSIVNIPLLGRIAAGAPVIADENIEDYIKLSRSFLPGGDLFALHVRGDSMIEGGILDGDIAVIRKQNTADDGEIVAALIDEEATLKEIDLSGEKPVLLPMNRYYSPIIVENLIILGKLAAVIRSY